MLLIHDLLPGHPPTLGGAYICCPLTPICWLTPRQNATSVTLADSDRSALMVNSTGLLINARYALSDRNSADNNNCLTSSLMPNPEFLYASANLFTVASSGSSYTKNLNSLRAIN